MSAAHSPTAFEQQLLEYLNRARTNPDGEFDALIADAGSVTGVQGNITSALRYFGVDMAALQAQFDALNPAAPLAWNGALADAAEGHSQQMIIHDAQSHQLPGEASLGTRIRDAGYSFSRAAENVYAYTQDPLHGHAGFFIDWGYDDADLSGGSLVPGWQNIGDGIQDAAGHRVAMMNAAFTEVGMSAIDDSADDPADVVGPYVVTQNFGARWSYTPQLLGVVIDDADGDNFYDIGEGLGGVTVTAVGAAGTFTTTTWDSGGYQVALPDGNYTVTASGGALAGTVTFSIAMSGANIKRDVMADDAVIAPDPGSPGDGLFAGGPGADILWGGLGSDTLQGEAGDDILYGDFLPVSAVSDLAAQIYRLYQATLGREPDSTGYQGWTEGLFEGSRSLVEVAEGFVASAEFQAAYGVLSASDFVELLYQNVLGRPSDPGGKQNWLDTLSGGGTQAEVVLGFSESAEFRLSTANAATLAAEAASAPAWQDDVFRLYQATLDRVPDLVGFLDWTTQLAGGRDYLEVVGGFVNSSEFQAAYGALSNADFVELLYQNVLGRPSDPGGKQSWLDTLSGGGTQAEVVRGFAQSQEFRTATQEDLETWIRDQGVQDMLVGGAGANTLAGGVLSDAFIFAPSDGGTHEVLDLESWDVIDLDAFGYASADQARGHMTESGADLVFADQGVMATFQNTRLSDISDDMLLI